MTEKVEHYQIGTVTHITLNGRYRIVFERSATKGVIGFKCEANGDNLDQIMNQAKALYQEAKGIADKESTEVAHDS